MGKGALHFGLWWRLMRPALWFGLSVALRVLLNWLFGIWGGLVCTQYFARSLVLSQHLEALARRLSWEGLGAVAPEYKCETVKDRTA